MLGFAENHEIIEIYYLVWYKPVGVVRDSISGPSDINDLYAWNLLNFVYSRSPSKIFAWILQFLKIHKLFHAFENIRSINLIIICLI